MSNHGSTEEITDRSASKNVEGKIPEFQTLTQEAVTEQIRGFIAPLTRELEELTRLEQGMSTSRHPNSYPRTEAWLYHFWYSRASVRHSHPTDFLRTFRKHDLQHSLLKINTKHKNLISGEDLFSKNSNI